MTAQDPKKPARHAGAKIEVQLVGVLMSASFGAGLWVRGAIVEQSPPAVVQRSQDCHPGLSRRH